MADLKISQLTGATTPLAGTEVLPVVQSSTTKKVAVSDLTAGRAVSAGSLALTSSPLPATSGGTGSSSAFTSTGVSYASSTTSLTTSTGLVFDGTRLGVGVTTPTANYGVLQVGGTSNASLYSQLGKDEIRMGVRAVGRVGIVLDNSDATYGNRMWFLDCYGPNGSLIIGRPGKDVATFNNDGSINMVDNLVQGTAAKGVNFTANTGAAGKTSQLLNWYEEGTWTATISDGTTDATMSSNTCQYTRVGRQVTVCGYIATSSVAGLTGSLLIKGLPFTIANGLSYYSGGSVGTCGNLAITANQVVSIYGVVNTTTIDVRLWDAATGTTGLLPAEWTNTGNMVFSLTYFA